MNGTVTTLDIENPTVAAAETSKLRELLGFRPAPETLAVRFRDASILGELNEGTIPTDGKPMTVWKCSLGGLKAGLTGPRPSEGSPIHEVLAPIPPTRFELFEGDSIVLSPADDLWSPAGPAAEGKVLNAFGGVIFDLDGTLVELDVEWLDVGEKLEDVIGFALEGPVADYRMDELVNVAHDVGKYSQVEAIFRRHELSGARTARSLELIELVDSLQCPVGICTSNSETAAEVALDRFDIRDHVEVIVGRETIDAYKPHPEPVARCLESMTVNPGKAVFIGDRETDARAAHRSGTNFLSESQLQP